MKSLFLITHGPKFDRMELIKTLEKEKACGTWFYSMPNSFFIYSALKAEDIAKLIEHKFGDGERYFIACLSASDYYGWMPKDHWSIVRNEGAEKAYELKYEGYYRNPQDMPHVSGLYSVYRGRYDSVTRRVTLRELLYIGKAEDINKRHENHENKTEWERCLLKDECLWYAYAQLPITELNRAESAMIYSAKPICNQSGKESFIWLDTLIITSGANSKLGERILVEQTK